MSQYIISLDSIRGDGYVVDVTERVNNFNLLEKKRLETYIRWIMKAYGADTGALIEIEPGGVKNIVKQVISFL